MATHPDVDGCRAAHCDDWLVTRVPGRSLAERCDRRVCRGADLDGSRASVGAAMGRKKAKKRLSARARVAELATLGTRRRPYTVRVSSRGFSLPSMRLRRCDYAGGSNMPFSRCRVTCA